MATFGKMDTQIDPSDIGKEFPIKSRVTFVINGKKEVGTITKQLRNAAIVEIDENPDNAKLINDSNGVAVVNYKKMQKI